MLHLYSQKSLLIVLHLLTFTEVRYVSFSWPMKFLYLKWSGSFLYEVMYLEHEEQLIFLPWLLHLQLCLLYKLVWASFKSCYMILKFRRPNKWTTIKVKSSFLCKIYDIVCHSINYKFHRNCICTLSQTWKYKCIQGKTYSKFSTVFSFRGQHFESKCTFIFAYIPHRIQ